MYVGKLARFRKLTESSQRWKLYLLAGIFGYYTAVNVFIKLRPDHIFLTLLLLSFVLGGERAKRFLLDWLPFVGFWILYDMTRGIADSWRGYVYVREIYDAEFAVFGKLFGNEIPSYVFQRFHYIYDAHLWKKAIDLIAANLYSFHFYGPMLFGWILWHTQNDRKMFYRFVWTLTILNAMALITFFILPAAPPWYVLRDGFDQPSGSYLGTAGSLINIDNMIKMKLFSNLWDNFNPNHFAAIPSLHGGYPIIISLFVYLKFKKYHTFVILYPLLVGWAAVYLNHHYIIDLMIAAVYVVIAYWINHKILMPKIFEPYILKEKQ